MSTMYDSDPASLEEEIQRELEGLTAEDIEEGGVLTDERSEDDDDRSVIEEESQVLPSMWSYMDRMQRQTSELERHLAECDHLLQHAAPVSSRKQEEEDELEEIARQEGLDVTRLKQKVMKELELVEGEAGSEEELAGDTDDEPVSGKDQQSDSNHYPNCMISQMDTDGSDATQQAEIKDKDVVDHKDHKESVSNNESKKQDEVIMATGGEMVEWLASDVLEHQLQRQLRDISKQHKYQDLIRKEEVEERKRIEERKQDDNGKKRLEKQAALEAEGDRLAAERAEREASMRDEVTALEEKMRQSLLNYESTIESLTAQTKEDLDYLARTRQEEEIKRRQKQEWAATVIQTNYRGCRVRMLHGTEVRERGEAAKKRVEEEKVKQIEERRKQEQVLKEQEREQEEKRKQDELTRLQEEKTREEEERKRHEEAKQQEEEERKRKAEEIRKEEERKRKAEEKRQEDLRKEEERKQKAEEKRQEQLRKEEEIQKKKEARKLEQQRRDEEKRKKEEEMRQRKQKEEDEKKLKVEAERLEKLRKGNVQRKTEIKVVDGQNNKEGVRNERLAVRNESLAVRNERLAEETHGDNMNNGELINGGITAHISAIHPVDNETSVALRHDESVAITTDSSNGMSGPTEHQSEGITVQSPEVSPSDQLSDKPNSIIRDRDSVRDSLAETWGQCMAESLEKRRLGWMKDCQPWAKTVGEQKSKKVVAAKRGQRRPASAKSLAPVDHSLILSAANVDSLTKVTTVELRELPGCSMAALNPCTHLRSLSMINCGLITVEGIDQCTQLLYLDLQRNQVEMVSLKTNTNLVYLDLCHNKLTSIHGLEACSHLRMLDVSHNNITRIGGLEGLRRLHTLRAHHNQLITTRGLGECPTIQALDVSYNHLPSLVDLNRLGLLQVLQAASNNLMQIPELTNHVLLNHLVLSDNNISSLRCLSHAWLPLLHSLQLSQNSITDIDQLSACISLHDLDISHNQVVDTGVFVRGLAGCRSLRSLSSHGCPAAEGPHYRDTLLKGLPCLTSLDGKVITASKPHSQPVPFESLCSGHVKQHHRIKGNYEQLLSKASSLEELYQASKSYFNQSQQLASEHRFTHEYGDVSPAPPRHPKSDVAESSPRMDQCPPSVSSQSQTGAMKNKFEEALRNASPRNDGVAGAKAEPHLAQAVNTAPTGRLPHDGGPACSHIVKELVRDGMAGGGVRYSRLHQRAATKIQALWRGYILRKRLHYALDYARMTGEADLDEDIDLPDVDLAAFDFNEDDLEKEWLPPETPQIPKQHPVLSKIPLIQPPAPSPQPQYYSGQPPLPTPPLNAHQVPTNPRQAWRNQDSPMDALPPTAVHFPSSKPPLPPLSRMSDATEGHSEVMSHKTGVSKKSEKLSEEWGFKDERTAQLMMARAKKLKYNADKKKKLSQLDARQRLALIRKLEQSTQLRPVQSPPKKAAARKEYFHAREEEVQQRVYEDKQERHEKVHRTFEWVHTQVSDQNMASPLPPVGRLKNAFGSEGNLPHIDMAAVPGRRPLESPASMDLQSVESVSVHGETAMPRRFSLQKTPSITGRQLPPLKTSSAPGVRKDEKISWRNAPVEKSVGWGGGKKRTH